MAKLAQFEGVFEIEIHPRKLRNGHKIRVIMEMPYTEDEYLKIAKLNFKDATVFLEEHDAQNELDGIEEEDDENQTGLQFEDPE